uniref:5-formyltetrahydrofolate cyclo-ligase n=1 Tax=uncultured Thiotrichaceae bacterium TaxID=298394 RepID=A0A6S6T1K6_9GAMM|nr:MAG: 5-formyltetrahydrofolate cyclo-ligase (EC [uncultured Thiotrichaceae bacterium]
MKIPLQAFRKSLKKQRSSLSRHQQLHLSSLATKRLQRLSVFRSAKNIAIYLPVRGEIDPSQLPAFGRANQRFYLPVLSLYKKHGLVFVRWNKQTRFRLNQYQIPEPVIKYSQLTSARKLDLVIMPLLAFDTTGSRLGMGGGYYDRSFAFKMRSGSKRKPTLLGIAYQFQQAESLPRQSWDVPLDAIVTNTQFTAFASGS